ncbi:helix-turn-helix transcriptional regulator [Arthrobacter sp.]|uniref:helix-turn-helix domain-containing protein n=1 Tax=Arthrobacter sp. TaxID=1667 RepID=UPI002811935F|nr:helix-turn-helix transcriptional regulator [Arthrobacter sp.]
MTVTAKAFQLWRNQIAPDATVSDLCRKADIKRSTLAQQLVRGKVSVETVVNIARAYGVPPVQALSQFDGYFDLADGILPPTPAEYLSQVSPMDLLRLILGRSEDADCVGRPVSFQLAPLPHRYSVRTWFDAVDRGELRQALTARTGIAPQNLSAQLSAGRLSTQLCVEVARVSGVSLANGLVVTGLLTPEEGGWAEDGREQVLSSLPDSELILIARDRLDGLGKRLRKQEQDSTRDKALWENLG